LDGERAGDRDRAPTDRTSTGNWPEPRRLAARTAGAKIRKRRPAGPRRREKARPFAVSRAGGGVGSRRVRVDDDNVPANNHQREGKRRPLLGAPFGFGCHANGGDRVSVHQGHVDNSLLGIGDAARPRVEHVVWR
jgi:hypothetical protein